MIDLRKLRPDLDLRLTKEVGIGVLYRRTPRYMRHRRVL